MFFVKPRMLPLNTNLLSQLSTEFWLQSIFNLQCGKTLVSETYSILAQLIVSQWRTEKKYMLLEAFVHVVCTNVLVAWCLADQDPVFPSLCMTSLLQSAHKQKYTHYSPRKHEAASLRRCPDTPSSGMQRMGLPPANTHWKIVWGCFLYSEEYLNKIGVIIGKWQQIYTLIIFCCILFAVAYKTSKSYCFLCQSQLRHTHWQHKTNALWHYFQ